jgi:transposase-like protein
MNAPPLTNPYKRHRFPVEIISHCVWLYFRFCLSYRDVEELMAERGITLTYEAVRYWCRKFGQAYANQLRRQHPRPGDKWHLDEVFLTVNGERRYLWRAVDQSGYVLDILVQRRRDAAAAKKFLQKLLKGLTYVPRVIVTDKLRSYGAAKQEILPSVRTSPASLFEQPRRELASADASARTTHAGLQVTRTRPALSRGIRPHCFAFPASASPLHLPYIPAGDGTAISNLARDYRHYQGRMRGYRGGALPRPSLGVASGGVNLTTPSRILQPPAWRQSPSGIFFGDDDPYLRGPTGPGHDDQPAGPRTYTGTRLAMVDGEGRSMPRRQDASGRRASRVLEPPLCPL